MKIIYPNLEGGISVIHNTGELPDNQVALKDTPFNRPFKIVDDTTIPTDRTFRNAWEADFSAPDGVGLGPQRWFIEQATREIAEIQSRVAPTAPVVNVYTPLVPVVFTQIVWEGEALDWTDVQKQEWYAGYAASVSQQNTQGLLGIQAQNEQQEKQYQKLLNSFNAQKENDLNRCNSLIAQMKQEVFQIEGVVI